MKRSYLALAIVILASGIAIYLHAHSPASGDIAPDPAPQARASTADPALKPGLGSGPSTLIDLTKPLVAGHSPRPATSGQPSEGLGGFTPAVEPPGPDPEVDPAPSDPLPEGIEPGPATPIPDPTLGAAPIEAAVRAAEAHVAAGRPADAMQTLTNALATAAGPAEADRLKERLSALTNEHLFSPKASPLGIEHDVVAGESLWAIARKHSTTIGLIKRINELKGDTIRIGQKLKIVQGAFDVEISKSQFRLTVYKDGKWVRELKVGLGKGGATPLGQFAAGPKIVNPPYTAVWPHIPSSDKQNNPLGTRWVTVKGVGGDQYGIHGTWEPDSIGKEESKGCIRMHNRDAEWLFDLIIPEKSKIAIKP